MAYLIVALVMALIVAVIAVQNAGPVNLVIFRWTVQTSLVPVILGAAALGAVTVGTAGFVRQLGMKIRIWDLQSRVRTLEGELADARESERRLLDEVRVLRGNTGGTGSQKDG